MFLSFPGVLASFKLPAYEEVAHCPTTPPPPYSAILAGSTSRLGSSTLTLTGSSENYTSCCSCESSCLTSPSSTSLSATDASTASEGGVGANASGAGGCSSYSRGGSWELPGVSVPFPAPKHALFASNVELFEGNMLQASDSEEGPEAGEEMEHFRHRRLTGDSGIEMGRGQEEEAAGDNSEEEEASHFLGKGTPVSPPSSDPLSLCRGQNEEDAENMASSSTMLPA